VPTFACEFSDATVMELAGAGAAFTVTVVEAEMFP